MRFMQTPLPGAWVIELDRLGDERGWFARTFDVAVDARPQSPTYRRTRHRNASFRRWCGPSCEARPQP
jgi:dTDP-4-dehydrorhamnose 3,5-epimerase-like enzyme